MPQSAGMFWKNFWKASSPPAEAPMPTTAQIGSLRPSERSTEDVACGSALRSTEDFDLGRRWPFPMGRSAEDFDGLLFFFLRMDGIREVPNVAIVSLPPAPSLVAALRSGGSAFCGRAN